MATSNRQKAALKREAEKRALNTPPTKVIHQYEGGKLVKKTKIEPKKEAINHPSHYGGCDNTYETIKVIEAWDLDFHLGNTVKYISRAGKKEGSSELQDLKKAAFYLQRKISNLEKTQIKNK